MGEVQSQPMNPHGQQVPEHNLIEKISEDIAEGIESDILDMQAKMMTDINAPHLWHSHQQSISTAHESSIGLEQLSPTKLTQLPKQPTYRKSKSVPHQDLRIEDYHKERMDEFIDEGTFKQEISRSYTEREGGRITKQEDSYQEFITKLVE